MNDLQKRCISNEIGAVQDDLVRARLQQRADPFWHSGNGQPIGQVIRELEQRLQKLREPL